MSFNRKVFISHSTKDKQVAAALCGYLESNGIPCWMAPRDIHVGTDYARSIIEAIESSAIMVLVLSAAANESKHVRNEVERGFTHELVIMPFRIQNITPGKSLEYFLSASQWLDAFGGKPEKYFPQLLANCKEILEVNESAKPAVVKTHSNHSKPRQPKTKMYIVAVACLAIIIASIVIITHKKTEPQSNTGIVKTDSLAIPKKDSLLVNTEKNSGIINTQSPAVSVKKQPSQKLVENAAITEEKTEKASPVSASLADKITGTYWQPDNADELTFSYTGNDAFVRGRIGGKSVSGQLSRKGNMSFKVTGATTGTLHFSPGFKNVTGILQSGNSVSLNVNLDKKED